MDWGVPCKDVKQDGEGEEGEKEEEEEEEGEGDCERRDLHHLMQSLDIVEHLHVLQVGLFVFGDKEGNANMMTLYA